MTAPSIKEALELLPCPFCSSADVVCCDQGDDDFAVTCKSCGASSPFNDDESKVVAAWNTRAALATLSPDGERRADLERYIPDIVKNAMLTMWNDICADTGCHPLDLEHGPRKNLTFTPRHWAEAAGKMVQQNIHDLYSSVVPSGERREAIAKALAEKWPGDYMQGDDEGQREPNALAYETADLILASGLMQDENSIRADEREKCARICDQIRNNAERRAGIHENGEARNAALDKMEGAIQCAAAIRSARDGGAES